MKKIKNTFVCDRCKEEIDKDDSFPYEDGWVYLHNINAKISSDKVIKEADKHFCCGVCAINHIRELLR